MSRFVVAGHSRRVFLAGVAVAAAGVAGIARRGVGAAEERTLEVTGAVAKPAKLTTADLAAMPQQEVTVSWSDVEDGKETRFRGPLLWDVLAASEPTPADGHSGDAMYVTVVGVDGYHSLLSFGEIDPEVGNAPVILAVEQDGQPLRAIFEPAWLVVPTDKVSMRSVFAAVRLEVGAVASGMATPTA